MKRLAAFALMLFGLALAAGIVGQPAPNIQGKTLTGEPFELADYLGKKPIALHFWATNCPPCHQEADYWRQAQEAYGDQIAIIGVDVQDITTLARDFVYQYGWTFPIVQDATAAVAAAYRVTGKPTTVFIGINGTVVGFHAGPYTSAAAFERDLIHAINWRP